MLTKLEAVNYLLGVLGSTPVGDLNTLHPDAEICVNRLDEELKTIQAEGWWFNREIGIELKPGSDGTISLPANTLKVLGIYGDFVIQRGIKLYDTRANSYVFNESICVDLVVQLEWDYVPFSVQDSVKYQAAREICAIDLEDSQKANDMETKRVVSYVQVKKDDLETKQLNIFNTPRVIQQRGGVRPYKGRKRNYNPIRPGG